MTIDPYILARPVTSPRPILLSIPHCGTEFPRELDGHFVPALAAALDDTDWHLQHLYDFASELGVTMIYARYSRWVIDLNREPEGAPLYDDGRLITELCPKTDFFGRSIYANNDYAPDESERQRRIGEYYRPYHETIDELLADLRTRYKDVVFWDGHSIRRRVESIRQEPFPDLILGNNNGNTASAEVITTALAGLKASGLGVNHNDPFRGGFLTRSKGNPSEGIHALQLEMSKDLYMDESETIYDEVKAAKMKEHLRSVFDLLIEFLSR